MSVKTFFAAMTLKMKIILVCAAVAVAGGTAAVVGVALTKEDSYRVIKVFELNGEAVVTRADQGDLDAYVGMNLESGDSLTVGDDSTLRISMDNDKYILLDSGTILELTATGTAADSRTVVDLKQGTILNEITNALSENSSYEVSTPKASMAVRGTSYMVSVEKEEDGSFIIRENTFQGNVEAELFDPKGNRTGNTALVPPDKGVTIRTEPDKDSGNPAEIDGTSSFVQEDMNGEISDLEEGKSPLHDIIYDDISSNIKDNAIRSNDEDLMILENDVINKLRGETGEKSDTSATTTATEAQTSASVTSITSAETTASETTSEQTEATTRATAVTTVPVSSVTTTVTTVPTEPETTTVRSVTTKPETTTVTSVTIKTETTTKTSVTTKSETTSKKSVTTVPTQAGTAPSYVSGYTGTTVITTVPTETEPITETIVSTVTETTSETTVSTETEVPTMTNDSTVSDTSTEMPSIPDTSDSTESVIPTEMPSIPDTSDSTESVIPTEIPSIPDTSDPTESVIPTEMPSVPDTSDPTESVIPTEMPSIPDTSDPTESVIPTEMPSVPDTSDPTESESPPTSS